MDFLLLAAQGTQSSQLVAAFKHNPTFLVMNMCCSAVVLTIVVERFVFQLTRYRVNSKEFFVSYARKSSMTEATIFAAPVFPSPSAT